MPRLDAGDMRSCQLPAALPEPEPPGALDAERCPKLWKQRVESLGWDQPGGRVRTGGAAGCGDVVWDPSHALGGPRPLCVPTAWPRASRCPFRRPTGRVRKG